MAVPYTGQYRRKKHYKLSITGTYRTVTDSFFPPSLPISPLKLSASFDKIHSP